MDHHAAEHTLGDCKPMAIDRRPIHAGDPPEVFELEAKYLATEVGIIEQFATDLLNDFSDPELRKVAAERWIETRKAKIWNGDATIGDAFKRLAISRLRRRGIEV